MLGEWARHFGLTPATVSRGFHLVYGTTPTRYRLEARTKRAAKLIVTSADSFASIAMECCFADQAHMTRAISNLTGRTPSALRRASNAFKTGREQVN